MKSLSSLEALQAHQLITEEAIEPLKAVVDEFSLAISEQMLDLIKAGEAQDPIAQQFIPSLQEAIIGPNDQSDPIGDHKHQKVQGIIHRYPDRCLFTPVHLCPVYCRFCFRREIVGKNSKSLNPAELDAAFNYIKSHPEIWEVIMTGGDPLILKAKSLKRLLLRFDEIAHVEVIRIHSRIPVVASERINESLIEALSSSKKTIYLVLHANHPKEFTPAAIKACKDLIDAGIPMLSQSVLLKNINNDIDTLSSLMRTFVKHRIKPYYLHHPDFAKGTGHFRCSIEEGQALMKALRGRFSGLCQPTYVLDIPGGYGKIPVGPSYLTHNESDHANYSLEDYLGLSHNYPRE